MESQLVVGALVALSQAGVGAGDTLVAAVLDRQTDLSAANLSRVALAISTMGISGPGIWHPLNARLAVAAQDMTTSQVSDVMMALATLGDCPLNLGVKLLSRLAKPDAWEAEDAATSAWALCVVELYDAAVLANLLRAAGAEALGEAASNQVQQVVLSLQYEDMAARARREMVAEDPKLWDALCRLEDPVGDDAEVEAMKFQSYVEELQGMMEGVGVSCETFLRVESFYTLHLAFPETKWCVLFDATAHSVQDPFARLKHRHLRAMGWQVQAIVPGEVGALDEDGRKEFVDGLLAASRGEE